MVRTHTVVAGETLSTLALRFYGDAELYRLIATASGITDPDVVECGTTADLPRLHEIHGRRGGHAVGVGGALLW